MPRYYKHMEKCIYKASACGHWIVVPQLFFLSFFLKCHTTSPETCSNKLIAYGFLKAINLLSKKDLLALV